MPSLLPSKSFCAQILTAGIMATTGDVICQKMVEKRERIDRARTSRFALAIMFHNAPLQYRWFRFLNSRFPTHQPRKLLELERVKVGIKRVAVDQTCFAPLLTASFLFTVLLIEFHSPEIAFDRMKRIYPDVMTNNYKFWPFVQAVNMALVPLHLRVVFFQFFAIFWNIYVSNKANGHQQQYTAGDLGNNGNGNGIEQQCEEDENSVPEPHEP